MTGKSWRIILGSDAEKDFVRILTYTTETFGSRQAEIYETTILDALAALGAGPNVPGSLARDDVRPRLRSLHVARNGRRGRHVLMYRVSDDGFIQIVRILHDAMDFARHVRPERD